MEKTIEQIKEEVAKELKYKDWIILRRCHLHKMDVFDALCTTVAIRYAKQFQTPTDTLITEISVLKDRVQELEECLREVTAQLELKQGFESSLSLEAKSLINKSK